MVYIFHELITVIIEMVGFGTCTLSGVYVCLWPVLRFVFFLHCTCLCLSNYRLRSFLLPCHTHRPHIICVTVVARLKAWTVCFFSDSYWLALVVRFASVMVYLVLAYDMFTDTLYLFIYC